MKYEHMNMGISLKYDHQMLLPIVIWSPHIALQSLSLTTFHLKKDISATINFFITIRRDNQEKYTLSFGCSPNKGGAQIDFGTFMKTEKVAKLEWRKPPNFTFTAAGYAGYACSCSSVSKLGPRARSCFRADLYLEVGSLRPLSDRLLGCRYGRQVAELNLRPGAGTTCQPI